MERVLNQSWQWVRDWVPPGLTAIALVAALAGLWYVMMEADRASTSAREPTSRPRTSTQASYRQAEPPRASAVASQEGETTRVSAEAATAVTECAGLQKEIDSLGVRARASGKSRQGTRFRARLRELQALYQEECRAPASVATID